MIHYYDLAALGLMPPAPARPPPRPVPAVLRPALAACDLADAAWDAGLALARAWLCVGWFALDAAERAWCR